MAGQNNRMGFSNDDEIEFRPLTDEELGVLDCSADSFHTAHTEDQSFRSCFDVSLCNTPNDSIALLSITRYSDITPVVSDTDTTPTLLTEVKANSDVGNSNVTPKRNVPCVPSKNTDKQLEVIEKVAAKFNLIRDMPTPVDSVHNESAQNVQTADTDRGHTDTPFPSRALVSQSSEARNDSITAVVANSIIDDICKNVVEEAERLSFCRFDESVASVASIRSTASSSPLKPGKGPKCSSPKPVASVVPIKRQIAPPRISVDKKISIPTLKPAALAHKPNQGFSDRFLKPSAAANSGKPKPCTLNSRQLLQPKLTTPVLKSLVLPSDPIMSSTPKSSLIGQEASKENRLLARNGTGLANALKDKKALKELDISVGEIANALGKINICQKNENLASKSLRRTPLGKNKNVLKLPKKAVESPVAAYINRKEEKKITPVRSLPKVSKIPLKKCVYQSAKAGGGVPIASQSMLDNSMPLVTVHVNTASNSNVRINESVYETYAVNVHGK